MSFVIFITYDYIMINCDDYTDENKTKHNLKWPNIPDHPAEY